MGFSWDDVAYDEQGNIKIKGQHGFTPWASNLFPYKKDGETYKDAPPLHLTYNGRIFGSVETTYQSAKALFYDRRLKAKFGVETQLFAIFHSAMGPMEAKKAAGKTEGSVKGSGFAYAIHAQVKITKKRAGEVYDEILKKDDVNWFGASMGIMRGLIEQKFGDANPAFARLLISTGTTPIYEQKFRGGTIWEKGGSKSGWGALGDLIMARRAELQTADEPEPKRM